MEYEDLACEPSSSTPQTGPKVFRKGQFYRPEGAYEKLVIPASSSSPA